MAPHSFASKISGAKGEMGVRSRKVRRPAVFLDRDGTIIRQVELLHRPSEVKIFREAAPAIRIFNRLGYLTIIATNQPVVARGIIEPKEVDRIHATLIKRLAKQGARIDAVYYCPHHPEANLKKYRAICECRKPGAGMLIEATKDLNIDLKKSFMIGDSTQDIVAGNRAGVRVILVRTGYGGKDPWHYEGKQDFSAKNLTGAARIIKKLSLVK